MTAEQLPAGPGPVITYTLFPDTAPTTCQERADVPWHELCAKLHDAPTYVSKRHCPLISLAAYGDVLSDKGCVRHAANVKRIYGVEIDYDGEEVTPDEGAARLRAASLRAVIYTSPSHVDGAPRWRALLPLSDAALPEMRILYAARANRALGGIATRESFTSKPKFLYRPRPRALPTASLKSTAVKSITPRISSPSTSPATPMVPLPTTLAATMSCARRSYRRGPLRGHAQTLLTLGGKGPRLR